MATLYYGGITLQVLSTNQVVREPIMSDDGTTFLYDHWLIDVNGMWNPALQSWTLPTNDPTAPVLAAAGANVPVATTDAAVRHILSIPRQKLVYSVGGIALITCPLDGYATDAGNGPISRVYGIQRVKGDKSLVIRFVVEAWVNECPGAGIVSPGSGGTPRKPVLAHRWRMSSDTDQHHFSLRAVEGIAVFRTDELNAQNLTPDQMRQDLFHPIPPGCRREQIHTEATEDGTSVRYRFVDRELAQSIGLGANSPVTDIEFYQTDWVNVPSVPKMIADQSMKGLGAVVRAGGSFLSGHLNEALGTAASAAVDQLQAVQKSLPENHIHFFCRVWGNKNSNRRTDLQALAMGLFVSRYASLPYILGAPSIEWSVTHDLMGKFVEAQMTFRYGGSPYSYARIAGSVWLIPADEHIAGGVITPDLVDNPAPPNSKASRGTFVGALVAQVLASPCQVPPAPVNRTSIDYSFRS